jgi:signal transduction histidine kinase/ligand-binding sensor domain-containing protein
LRSSSIFRSSVRWIGGWLAAVTVVTATVAAQRADAPHAGPQYLRTRWDVEQGFLGGAVSGLAQSADGYLWIGTDKGLVRFDGLTFRLMTGGQGQIPITAVLGLTSDADGVVWARLQGFHLLRCRGEAIEEETAPIVATEADFTAMSRSHTGRILLAGLRSGLIRHNGAGFTQLSRDISLPRSVVIALAETSTGTVWFGTRDLGLFTLGSDSGQRPTRIDGVPDPKVNTVLALSDRDVWIGTDNGIAHWDGTRVDRTGIPRALDGVQALTIIRDRAANVWIGTTRGVVRLDPNGALSLDDRDRDGGAVTALFEDREGNVWTGDARGIERFRASAFTTYADPKRPARSNGSTSHGPIYVDASHDVWFGPPAGGLYRLSNSSAEPISIPGLTGDIVYSIDGTDHDVWIGRQRGGLTHVREDGRSLEVRTYTQADGLAENSVYAVHVARDRSVWAATLSRGLSRLKDGRFTTFTTADGLPSNTVVAIAEGADATIWCAMPIGLAAWSQGRWRRYGATDGLPSDDVTALFTDASGTLWVGTAAGLAAIDPSGTVRPVNDAPSLLKTRVHGLAADRNGSLWIATPTDVLRVARQPLLQGRVRDADVRQYGTADGLRSVEIVKRHRSLVADGQGRLWFSMTRGLSVIDPGRTTGSAAPALVQVQAVAADGAPLDLRRPLWIPAAKQRVTLSYAGLSLSVPERVRFRYRLDNFDHDWSEPTAAHEAVYTNLAPGAYTFRVMASNSEGVWNGGEATIGFGIEPVFWQTWWFRVSAIALAALTILSLYRLRLHQMTRQLQLRFDERLAERTRIAQELHDTLLQGFVSASMQLHVATDRLPEDSPAKASLGRVLQLMRQVIDEGRNAVRGLRSSQSPRDLAEAFSGIQQEIGTADRVDYRVVVEGQPQPLNPVVRDEVYRIGREALVNAFRHAEAKTIEVELEYAARHVRMLVRDDGRGMEPEVVKSGADGHWGLSGMRERAERIGARFKVFSRARAGTEVELLIPAHIAFRREKDR